jgi:hypothetical protein
VGVKQVSKLCVKYGFVWVSAEIGKVGLKLLELAVEVGRGGEEFGGKVIGCKVPCENKGVEGDTAVAIGGDGGVN